MQYNFSLHILSYQKTRLRKLQGTLKLSVEAFNFSKIFVKNYILFILSMASLRSSYELFQT